MQRREGGKYVECGALNVLLFTNYGCSAMRRFSSDQPPASIIDNRSSIIDFPMGHEPSTINPVYLVHLVYPVCFVTAFKVITWNVEH